MAFVSLSTDLGPGTTPLRTPRKLSDRTSPQERRSQCCSLTELSHPAHFRAMEKLSGHQFENYSFKISYIPDEEVSSPPPPQGAQRGDHSSREQGHAPGGSSQARQIDFPLRILVPTQFVGAIIGKEGLTIKNITKQTQSRYVPPGLPLLLSRGPLCWWV